MVPCKTPVEEVSFKWSHHRISKTDSKVGTILQVSIIIESGSKEFKKKIINFTLFRPCRQAEDCVCIAFIPL